MTVGERIKAAREKAGLTQLQLAQRLGAKTFQNVSKWELGRRNPKIETLRKISEAIGCPLSDLIDDSDIGMRNVEEMRAIVEQERVHWKAKIYEKLRLNDFDAARARLFVLQGVEFLAEDLGLMDRNFDQQAALIELINNAESAFILAQKGEGHNAEL